MATKVERLEAELRQAREAESAERERLRAATPIVMRFTLVPDERPGRDELWDDTCRWYYLEGEVVNAEEAAAAGHKVADHSGGMAYLFNTLSGKFVMSSGGGRVWITGKRWAWTGGPNVRDEWEASAQRALTHLAGFVKANPEGGDVTEIIETHRAECGRGE
jgi:hypothetical protein